MFFSLVFGVDKDVIKIYYHKNVEFFRKNSINIVLECGRYVDQSKKYYLILEMAITGPKSRFLFIIFFDLHLMVGIGQVK